MSKTESKVSYNEAELKSKLGLKWSIKTLKNQVSFFALQKSNPFLVSIVSQGLESGKIKKKWSIENCRGQCFRLVFMRKLCTSVDDLPPTFSPCHEVGGDDKIKVL